MAAKKNVEEVKNTQETVAEEPVVDVVDETITEDANTEKTESETVEKKDNFISRWAKKEKEDFKAAPVKYVAKKAIQALELGLAIVGTKTIYNSIKGSDTAENTVELLTDSVSDAIEDVKVEEF